MAVPLSSLLTPGYLAQTNHPQLDQQVGIAFIAINTFFLVLLFISRHYNPKAVVIPMLVCNTLCYLMCLAISIVGICECSHFFFFFQNIIQTGIMKFYVQKVESAHAKKGG